MTRDNDIDPLSQVARKRYEFYKELTPISQAGVVFARITPGVAFEIVSVQSWTRNANAAARVDVRISSVTALAAPFAPAIGAANAPTVGVLAAARFGTAAQTIDIYLTTDGGQVMDDCTVIVEWRPRVYRHSP
ncbi:MAG: hypothetical protein ACRDQZ_13100 [Mycobacteriales bacterium]